MGYTTSFEGKVDFSRPLAVPEFNQLKELANYDQALYNKYSPEHPDSYNQWEPSEDGMSLRWNGGEKFYDYVDWLEWLVKNYFKPRSIELNGTFRYQGEEIGDVGRIEVKDSSVKLVRLEPSGIVECPNCGERFKPGD